MVSEKRLIDANALKGQFIDYVRTPPHFHYGDWQNMCINGTEIDEVIENAPTVDAVEVVRCKDCHWWRLVNTRNGCGICQHEVFSVDDCTVDPVTEPTDFCSYGERREGE